MKRIALLLITVVTIAGVGSVTVPASLHAYQAATPIFVTQISPGYRGWRLISVTHEEDSLNSFVAVLGNDVAIKAYREGKVPFPGADEVREPRMYQLIRQKGSITDATFEIEFLDPGVEASSFTFS